jgi:hypothetical protein
MEISRPAGIGAWRDVDMAWDEAARGFMVANQYREQAVVHANVWP